MKINKKIVAVIALVLIFVISATATLLILREPPQDNKTSTSSVTTTVETTKETSEEETEEETTTQKFTTTVPTTKAPVATSLTDSDIYNFEQLMAHVLYHGYEYSDDYETFDYKSSDALKYAISRVFTPYYYNLLTFIDESLYGFGNYEVSSEFYNYNDAERDPKGLWYQYSTVSQEYVDMVFRYVFNVDPKDTDMFYDNNNNLIAYYQDEICYMINEDGGDGAGPEVKILDIEQKNDSRYEITAAFVEMDYKHILNRYDDVKVTAEIKSIEGKRLWSIYKIEKAPASGKKAAENPSGLKAGCYYQISNTPNGKGTPYYSLPIESAAQKSIISEGSEVFIVSDGNNNKTGFVYCIFYNPETSEEIFGYIPKKYLEFYEDFGRTDFNVYKHYVCYNTPSHEGINLRSEPSTYSDLIIPLHEGSTVYLPSKIERSGEYIRVFYYNPFINGNESPELLVGWVLDKYIV